MYKQNLYVVTDIETTLKYRVAFDIAWQIINKHGEIFDKGSYVVKEAFNMDVPYFKEKLGEYFSDTYSHLIKPMSMGDVKQEFNEQVSKYLNKGHKVIFCAYNAAFDTKYLRETSQRILKQNFMNVKVPILDIWDFWCQSAPKGYNYATPKGNPKTSAEAVYRYEMNRKHFVERHIAWDDVEIESDILTKVLARKKKIPMVNKPSELNSQPWRRLLKYPKYQSGETIMFE